MNVFSLFIRSIIPIESRCFRLLALFERYCV